MVQGTEYNSNFPASNVLIDGGHCSAMQWFAEQGKTTGQGFTVRVDNCTRLIDGCQIKNNDCVRVYKKATKKFRLMGSSLNENGPWEILLEYELPNRLGSYRPPLVDLYFEEPVEIQFLKFELVSYWGSEGGGLKYFAPLLAPSKAS